MKVCRLLCLLALCAAPSGCSWTPYAVWNLWEAPCDVLHRTGLNCRFRRQADDAWDHVLQASPDGAYSQTYADGFKEGFVDFLDADGTGDPPAAPGWCYRTPRFLTPEGKQEVEDWFAGFRHGAAVARASGLRQAVVVPLALPPIHATLGMPEMAERPAPPPEQPPEPLPLPRTLPSPEGN
jgi:hypothetical protein